MKQIKTDKKDRNRKTHINTEETDENTRKADKTDENR